MKGIIKLIRQTMILLSKQNNYCNVGTVYFKKYIIRISLKRTVCIDRPKWKK